MRARNIKPGFFKNEELASCSPICRLLFIGLWCMADREGRLEKRPLRIKAEIFPYENSLDINGELTVLERLGFVRSYVIGTNEYLQVVHFLDHQRPHHTEAKSKLPAISNSSEITVNSRLNNGDGITVSSPLVNGEYPPDSLIHRFTDSLIQKPSPDIPPMSEIETGAKQSGLGQVMDEKLSLREFALLYHRTFGKMMPPMLNHTADVTCSTYSREWIEAAFETAAASGATHFNFVKRVLETRREGEMTDDDWAALEAQG